MAITRRQNCNLDRGNRVVAILDFPFAAIILSQRKTEALNGFLRASYAFWHWACTKGDGESIEILDITAVFYSARRFLVEPARWTILMTDSFWPRLKAICNTIQLQD
ncbi:hypothetical protein CLIM01_01907 [Colletotrichum limetticola]|uniref:Uncharacterized protein n=1 Tax=Colletotrichum limetticola TaxID=1209924 RepID=A0ABQ9QA78_9PEZI|nr:hypothetical protein CLIM01_01907 [Colletotrichum limetticola]